MRILLILLTLCGGFFSGACTSAQRRDAIDYIEDRIEERVREGVASAVDGLKEYVDKKVASQEAALLAKVDVDLAAVADVDPATGLKAPLTWKNFDTNNNGSLDADELKQIGIYQAAQAAKKVATGEMSTEDAKKYGTGAAGTLGLLALIALYRRKTGTTAPPPTPPPPAPSS